MLDKKGIYADLKEKNIAFTAVEHKAVFTVEEAEALHLPEPEAGAKNLFLCDDKKRQFYLLTVRDLMPVRLKEVQEKIGSRRLRFAPEEELQKRLGLIKGSVTPLGVLNDEERSVKVFVDVWFEGKRIAVHPNENTATIYLACDDLMERIRDHGNEIRYLDLETERQDISLQRITKDGE